MQPKSQELSLSILEPLAKARQDGALIHDLPAEVTHVLAEEHGLRTVETPRHPGSFWEYRRQAQYRRALGKIATNTTIMFANMPEDAFGFSEAATEGRLATKLDEVFDAITDMEAEGVRIIDPKYIKKEMVDGTVSVDRLTLTVDTNDQAQALSFALQAFMHKENLDYFRPVRWNPADTKSQSMGGNDDVSKPNVVIYEATEHDFRSIDRARHALWLAELAAKGVDVPLTKTTFDEMEESGETSPEWFRAEQLFAREQYESVPARASYVNPENPNDISEIEEVPLSRLVVSDLRKFKRTRDIVRKYVYWLRGDKYMNPEQNPVKAARPSIESGVNLKRDRKASGGARTLSLKEQATIKAKDLYENFRQHPARATWDGAVWSLKRAFGGLADLAIAPVEYIPAGFKYVGQLCTDTANWKIQKHKAVVDGKKLDVVVSRLVAVRDGLLDRLAELRVPVESGGSSERLHLRVGAPDMQSATLRDSGQPRARRDRPARRRA